MIPTHAKTSLLPSIVASCTTSITFIIALVYFDFHYFSCMQDYKIRLVGGRNPTEGRIEVFLGKRWGIICGQRWGLWEAMVACGQLGLGYAKQAIQVSSSTY